MTPATVIAITFANGTIGRMQVYRSNPSDADIQAIIDKTVWPDGQAASWQRVESVDRFEHIEDGKLSLKP